MAVGKDGMKGGAGGMSGGGGMKLPPRGKASATLPRKTGNGPGHVIAGGVSAANGKRKMNKPFFDFADSAPPTPEGLTGGKAGEKAGEKAGVRPAAQGPAAPSRPRPEGAGDTKATPPAVATARSAERGAATRGSGSSSARRAGPPPRERGGREKAAAPPQARAGTALMLAVFALSAIVGGGAAGLMLAFTQTDSPGRSAATTEGVGIITPIIAKRDDTGASGAGEAGSAILPKREAGPAMVKRAASPPATGAPTANGENGTRAAAVTTAGQPATASADAAGTAELARLTNQVVAALGALNGGDGADEAAAEQTITGAERLRSTLAELVGAAQAQGKSDEEIRKLVAEALDSVGEENIPAILRDASGKVNVQRLLASVTPSSRRDVMPKDSEGMAYFRQLEEEADATSADNPPTATAARKASGRFFVRGGKRYTIIRKGDTLGDIAYAAYGDVLAYPAILRANRGRISVRNLRPGTRIVIPELNRPARRSRVKARRNGAAATPPRKTRTRAGTRRKPANVKQPVGDKIITLPASGAAGASAAAQKPVKVMNFRSAREARPLPITPQKTPE